MFSGSVPANPGLGGADEVEIRAKKLRDLIEARRMEYQATPSAGSRKDLLGFVEYDGPLQSKVHDEVGGRVWAIA